MIVLFPTILIEFGLESHPKLRPRMAYIKEIKNYLDGKKQL